MSYGRNNYTRVGASPNDTMAQQCQAYMSNAGGALCGADNENNNDCTRLTSWQNRFEHYRKCLPSYIQEGLNAGTLIETPHTIYSTRPVTSNTQFFQNSDNYVTGYINLANQKLQDGQAFVCFGLRLGSAVLTPPASGAIWLLNGDFWANTADDPNSAAGTAKVVVYQSRLAPELENGEIEVKINQKYAMYRNSCSMFNNGLNNPYPGLHELQVPIVFQDKVLLEVNHYVQTSLTITTNLVARLEMYGILIRDNYIASAQ